VVAVEDDAVLGTQKAGGTGFGRRGGDLGHGDRLEDRDEEFGQFHFAHRLGNIFEHFAPQGGASGAAGQQADADFHQAHVEFGMGHDAVRAQTDFAAAAQGEAKGRRHDRIRSSSGRAASHPGGA
jgi:hypothetical protein